MQKLVLWKYVVSIGSLDVKVNEKNEKNAIYSIQQENNLWIAIAYQNLDWNSNLYQV